MSKKMSQRTVRIRVDVSQATNIAEWALYKALRDGSPCIVSDACVVKALLALAKERDVKVDFYAVEEERLAKVPVDLAGVKRVLEGGRP